MPLQWRFSSHAERGSETNQCLLLNPGFCIGLLNPWDLQSSPSLLGAQHGAATSLCGQGCLQWGAVGIGTPQSIGGITGLHKQGPSDLQTDYFEVKRQ